LKLSKPVQHPDQGKFVPYKALRISISGLRISGSKRINLSQVRDLRQINGYQRELVAMMHGSKHGYPALRLILLWSLGGFLLIGHSYQYPLDRRNAKIYMVTWGLPVQT
jgi:hypothetical protein